MNVAKHDIYNKTKSRKKEFGKMWEKINIELLVETFSKIDTYLNVVHGDTFQITTRL